MNLKEIFFDFFNLYIEKKTSDKKIKKILLNLKPFDLGIKLIRLGEDSDGGYLIPDDLENIEYCFTAGVGELTKFEQDLERKFNIRSFMADPGNIDLNKIPSKSKFINKKISFLKESNGLNINDFIGENKDIILKVDIEGDEYENLINIEDKKLQQVRILILELHDLRNLRSDLFCRLFDKIIKKLNNIFYICHLHPNNSGKVKKIGNFLVPDMLEVTLINKNRIKIIPKNLAELPHSLDQKIDIKKKEIFIDQKWFN